MPVLPMLRQPGSSPRKLIETRRAKTAKTGLVRSMREAVPKACARNLPHDPYPRKDGWMNLTSLFIALLLFGGALAIVQAAPIDGTVKRIIQVVAIVALVIWVLRHLPAITS